MWRRPVCTFFLNVCYTATAAVAFKVQVHPEGAFTFGFGQLSLDEETPKCAVITHRLSLAFLTVSGRPNLWTLSVLRGRFCMNLCAAGLSVYEISLECKTHQNKQINSFWISHRRAALRCFGAALKIFDYNRYQADVMSSFFFLRQPAVKSCWWNSASINHFHIQFRHRYKTTSKQGHRQAAPTALTPLLYLWECVFFQAERPCVVLRVLFSTSQGNDGVSLIANELTVHQSLALFFPGCLCYSEIKITNEFDLW